MNTLLTVILIVVGAALLVVELFLIPGIGFAGLFGIGSIAAGVAVAYYLVSPLAGHISLACGIVLCAVGIFIFLRAKTLDKMALKTDVSSKVDLMQETGISVGDTGMTISRLSPMGKVRINGVDIEAKSLDSFVDENKEIVVEAIEGNKVLVKGTSKNSPFLE